MSVTDRQIPIESPCPITLDRTNMSRSERSMYCDHCSKDVHLLSEMTETQAREFLVDRAGEDICVSYAIKKDGKIRFRPSTPPPVLVPVTALTRRSRPVAPPSSSPVQRLAMAASVGAAVALSACAPHGDPADIDQIQLEDPSDQPCEPTIPDAPHFTDDDLLVDGGIIAEPIVEPPTQPPETHQAIRGGIRARPVDLDPQPEPAQTKRGKIKRPVDL